MSAPLEHNDTLGRLIRSGGWAELAEGTPRLIARAIEAGDRDAAAALADFFLGEIDVVYNIYTQWFCDTRKCLSDKGMNPAKLRQAEDEIDARLAPYHATASRDRAEVRADMASCLERVKAGAGTDGLDEAVATWRSLHDYEVSKLSGLFCLVVERHGEPALREMYESWVIGDWFAKRYQRFDVSKIDWGTASWLLTYLAFEGHHGHLSGSGRDGTIDYAEDDEKVTISFAPCGSGGQTMERNHHSNQPPLAAPDLGWPELTGAHDFTWSETGICAYCAHCCILHETLPIAAFGYPVRMTHPPKAPLTSESRCSWTVYKNLRAIPQEAYTRVGAVKPPDDAPLGSKGRHARDVAVGRALVG